MISLKTNHRTPWMQLIDAPPDKYHNMQVMDKVMPRNRPNRQYCVTAIKILFQIHHF